MSSRCSFAKISVLGTFELPQNWNIGTELFERLFYLENGNTRVLIGAFDFSCIFPEMALEWRKAVSEATGIPLGNIWFHELQIHGAPEGTAFRSRGMNELITRSLPVIKDMIENAIPFTCESVDADFGYEESVNRQQYVRELGGVTIWSGLEYDSNGIAHCERSERMLLSDYRPVLPAFNQPILFLNPVDPKAYLFVFRDTSGKVIGTISRFAAHPDVSVLFESHPGHNPCDYHTNFDFTGYLAERLERDFGGVSVYLNGPCADLSVKKCYEGNDTYEKSDAEAKRIGNHICDRLEKAYQAERCILRDAELLKADCFKITISARDDLPGKIRTIKERDNLYNEDRKVLAQMMERNDSPAHIKAFIDDMLRLSTEDYIVQYSGLYENGVKVRNSVDFDIPAFCFGPYLFVGMPGEIVVDITLWLRSEFSGAKTIPLDQVNGYHAYITSPLWLYAGGYTYWNSWVRPESLMEIESQLYPKLKEFLLR